MLKGVQKKKSLWQVILYGLKFTLKHMPAIFTAFCLFALANAITDGFILLVMNWFFDSVEGALKNQVPLKHVYLIIVAMGLVYVLASVMSGGRSMMFMALIDKVNGEISRTIHEKMARINPIHLEDIEFHDDIEKAARGAHSMLVFVVNWGIVMIVMYYIPYFLLVGLYLRNLKPEFVFAFVIMLIPIAFAQLIRTRIIAKLEDETAPLTREYRHYDAAITDKEYFKETRLLGAYPFFFRRLKSTLTSLAKADWQAAKKTSLLELCINILSAAGYMAIVIMLIKALLMGEISIGAFVAVFTAMGMMYENLEYVVNDHFGAMMRDMGKAQNYFRYMEMPERAGADMQANFEEGIVAKDISFMYPGTQHLSISDVSLVIKAGETIAIVGANGAGKTTLVRLLLGLYMPNEGTVVANGMDTALANEKSLFAGVSGVFQRFQKYELTLNENVRAGDFASEETIDSAMRLANVDINSGNFPNGTDTMLSRSFEGGVDLSGGEWQRVAIARGLYRKHNLIVLDEPTAAIDPLEESRIYKQFVDISQGKTAVIVTHRLGSTRIADRVVVMNKGKIAETGTHDELMQHCGLYAEMFHAQAGWYDEDSVKFDTAGKM